MRHGQLQFPVGGSCGLGKDLRHSRGYKEGKMGTRLCGLGLQELAPKEEEEGKIDKAARFGKYKIQAAV